MPKVKHLLAMTTDFVQVVTLRFYVLNTKNGSVCQLTKTVPLGAVFVAFRISILVFRNTSFDSLPSLASSNSPYALCHGYFSAEKFRDPDSLAFARSVLARAPCIRSLTNLLSPHCRVQSLFGEKFVVSA